MVGVQVFVDLRLRIGGLVERDPDHAVGRGHGLGQQAGLGALDVEIADLAEVEQALVIVRPLRHVALVEVVGQVVDEGQAEALGHQVHAGQVFVVRIMDGALGVVAVHQVQHAATDTLDHRRGHRLAQLVLRVEGLGAVLQRLYPHPLGQLAEADGKATGGRAMFGGEARGERIRILVDQEGAVALAPGADRPGLVAGDLDEAEFAEIVAQRLGLPGRCGIFDELEAVDPHRVLELGDHHARVGTGGRGLRLRAHGGLLNIPVRGSGT